MCIRSRLKLFKRKIIVELREWIVAAEHYEQYQGRTDKPWYVLRRTKKATYIKRFMQYMISKLQ